MLACITTKEVNEMSNSMNSLAALGALFLLGVFIGLILADTGRQIDFTLVSAKQGTGFRVSSNAALLM
jgi:hypothetical protein